MLLGEYEAGDTGTTGQNPNGRAYGVMGTGNLGTTGKDFFLPSLRGNKAGTQATIANPTHGRQNFILRVLPIASPGRDGGLRVREST